MRARVSPSSTEKLRSCTAFSPPKWMPIPFTISTLPIYSLPLPYLHWSDGAASRKHSDQPLVTCRDDPQHSVGTPEDDRHENQGIEDQLGSGKGTPEPALHQG